MSREFDPLEREFDRRRFLFGAAGAYVVLAGGDALAANPDDVVAIQPIPGGPQKSLVVDVRRPQDFLSLRFELWNMQLDSSDPANPVVKRAQAGKASYLVVVFPPQNIAEEAFDEPAPEFNSNINTGLQPPGSVRHRLAGGSRLGFQVPAGVAIPFTYAGLLGWTGLAPKLVPVATFVGRQIGVMAPKLAIPEEFETAIELPWRLVLSPNAQGKWEHAAEPVEHGGRTELWHTRLSGSDSARRIRAVWALDPNFPGSLNGQVPDNNDLPFPMSLNERHRASIVRNSSDWYSSALPQPEPVQSELLMLTALGGWIDARGVWDVQVNDENIALEEWRHKGTLGRDHYVRIVEKGFLFPFGHPAVVIKVVERKIQSEQVLSPNVAYLRRRLFVVVRNPNRQLGGVPGQPFDGRGFPFDHVRITTLVTPNLLPRTQTPYGGGLTATAAWIPHVAPDQPFRFHGIGTDKTGKPHEFTTPLVFVDVNAAFLQTDAIVEHYPTLDESLRMLDLSGQSVAIAPTDPQVEKPGDTDVEIDELLLGSELANGSVAQGQPPYFPTMESALVRLAAAEQASGGTVKPSIAYYEPYRMTGFQGAGEVFAELTTDAGIDFRTDRSGGVIQPSFGISALSRKLGPTGGTPSTVDGGTVNPADFFGNTGKLLGGVLLQDILDDITDFAGSKALKLESRRFDDRLETELHWQPDLVSDTVPIFDTKGTATLDLNALIVTRLASPGDSEITVRGDLRNFAINLFGPSEPEGFVRIDVDRLAFTSLPNRSSEVDVAIREVTFLGVLKFVQQLQELMSIGDGGSGPSIDVTPAGIEARFAVPIPSIQVGVFGISNIKFGAGVLIPFSGEAVVVDFNFSEREDMFNLQVAWFAGGGFFGIEIGAGYIKKVEAALEFGARLALDVGVASGMVEAMAGIYFSFGTDPATNVDTTVLTGYVRLRGELEVIEIVSLTITFDISLTYKVVGGNDKAIGQATVTVTIEVFVFSGDVTMTAERRFGKGSGDPTLGEQMSAADWAGYASKFAPVPA